MTASGIEGGWGTGKQHTYLSSDSAHPPRQRHLEESGAERKRNRLDMASTLGMTGAIYERGIEDRETIRRTARIEISENS